MNSFIHCDAICSPYVSHSDYYNPICLIVNHFFTEESKFDLRHQTEMKRRSQYVFIGLKMEKSSVINEYRIRSNAAPLLNRAPGYVKSPVFGVFLE